VAARGEPGRRDPDTAPGGSTPTGDVAARGAQVAANNGGQARGNLTAMDRGRMLEKCREGQWRLSDLDWGVPPRSMSRDQETAVVQYFTDMAGIERLAKAMFEEQRRRADDPVLKKIFGTFVVDEERHAQCAEQLARHYDVHQYRDYRVNEHLERFAPHFIDAVHYLSAEIANAYITTGELLLDIALLRSLDDYVSDDMSHQAMERINRDESRHIAVDYHMVEYYSSPQYLLDRAAEPTRPWPEKLRGWWAFCNMLYFASPFLRDVFFAPLDMCDPSGRRLKQAFKRIQLLGNKPGVAARPFTRFLRTVQTLFNHPVTGRLFGRVLLRIAGVDARVMGQLYDDDELERVTRMSFDELAAEAVQEKYQPA
jgi:rubrerythrin